MRADYIFTYRCGRATYFKSLGLEQKLRSLLIRCTGVPAFLVVIYHTVHTVRNLITVYDCYIRQEMSDTTIINCDESGIVVTRCNNTTRNAGTPAWQISRLRSFCSNLNDLKYVALPMVGEDIVCSYKTTIVR